MKEGIDAVIVDSVLAIRKGLQASSDTAAPAIAQTMQETLPAETLVASCMPDTNTGKLQTTAKGLAVK